MKFGMNQKTTYAYTKGDFIGELGQVGEQIMVEATWLGNFEQYTIAEISSFNFRFIK